MSDERTSQKGLYTFTSPVVMVFPNLFKPRSFTKNAAANDAKYDAKFLFEEISPDLKSMKQVILEVAEAKWPGRNKKELHYPFASGTKQADDAKAKGKDLDFMRGKVVLTARSQFAPRLSAVENGSLVEYLDENLRAAAAPKFYNGVQVLAQVNFASYESAGFGDGITAYLRMVLSFNRGDRIGSGASAAEVFSSYIGHLSTEDPYDAPF